MIGILLDHGHSVVTTVRSQSKVLKLQSLYPNIPTSKLDFVIVEDVGKEGAFDRAVVSEHPFDVVIHTASPVGDGTPPSNLRRLMSGVSSTSTSRTSKLNFWTLLFTAQPVNTSDILRRRALICD